MPKKPIIIANWKMNLGVRESVDLVKAVNDQGAVSNNEVEIVVCPSFTALASVSDSLHLKSDIKLGAQNVFWEYKGAFTGEISPLMLKELGCEYVIIGHSERRGHLGETDEMVHKKAKAVLDAGLIPIICVGENFDERQKGQKDYVIMKQMNQALEGLRLSEDSKIIIAYEPVWVIGSGQAIEAEEAEHTHIIIESYLLDIYSPDTLAKKLRVIYGGSVDKNNVAEFIGQKTIDGVLVGGASLKVEEFVGLIKAVQRIA
ncbi:triose-phosphate isomerase [Patescibacteria group bacterium]|nr:triose-phosphate isomerase [Patescibacteria group bacterium]MBU4512622.1 triose-phosphate isomerase [Patescibacteria group bacterium]MCG2693528.1 triose-phosphate isomerase [Candidatus Parcubacteria bacterium]